SRCPNTAVSHTVSRFPTRATSTTATGGPPATIPTGITMIASNHGIAPPMNMPSRIDHCAAVIAASRLQDFQAGTEGHAHPLPGSPRVLVDHRREVDVPTQPLQVGAMGTQGGIAVVDRGTDVHAVTLLRRPG